MFAGLARPASRGRLILHSADPLAPLAIDANMLSDDADLMAARACVEFCRELGNAQAFRPFVRGESMPGALKRPALDDYIRDAAVTYWQPIMHRRRWGEMPCRWSTLSLRVLRH